MDASAGDSRRVRPCSPRLAAEARRRGKRSARSGADGSQRFGEEGDSSGVPAVTRSAVGAPNAAHRAHDHALAQQRCVQLPPRPRRPRRRGSCRRAGPTGSCPSSRRGTRLRSSAIASALTRRRRASSAPSPRLASAAACAAVDTSNARCTLWIPRRAPPDRRRSRPGTRRARRSSRRSAARSARRPRWRYSATGVGVVGVVDVLEVRLVDDSDDVLRDTGRSTRRARGARAHSSRSGCSASRTKTSFVPAG